MVKHKTNNAIKFREDAILKLQSNPPPEWTPEYAEVNIQIIRDQIVMLKESS